MICMRRDSAPPYSILIALSIFIIIAALSAGCFPRTDWDLRGGWTSTPSSAPAASGYSITFKNGATVLGTAHVQEGDPVPIDFNDKVSVPAGLYLDTELALFSFKGWYRDDSFTEPAPITVDQDLTLYGNWMLPKPKPPPSNAVAAAVDYVNDNPDEYTLLVDREIISVAARVLNKTGAKLTIKGIGEIESELRLSGTGSLFIVGAPSQSGIRLTISEKIALVGSTVNSASLVQVQNGAELKMIGGTIRGNEYSGNGGGVFLTGSGTRFTMIGGTISGNTAKNGGGVAVTDGGSFEMSSDAEISGNHAEQGGGVYSYNNSAGFTMEGGTIYNNTATTINTTDGFVNGGGGGGVYISSGSGKFEMRGNAVIRGNTAGDGGGVYVYGPTSFDMSGNAEISGNHAVSTTNPPGNGGGVFVFGSGSGDASFDMIGGTIRGNDAIGNGGGVYVRTTNASDAIFTMSGDAEISGNSAANGGGVGVNAAGTESGTASFEMSGGKISRNDASGNGGGVYVNKTGTGSGSASFTMSDGFVYGLGSASPNSATGSGQALFSNSSSTVSYGGDYTTYGTMPNTSNSTLPPTP